LPWRCRLTSVLYCDGIRSVIVGTKAGNRLTLFNGRGQMAVTLERSA